METVLVTGAAVRLGACIAESLAEDGCFVWIHYFSHESEARTLRNKILSRGGRAECIRCDLSNTVEIDHMVDLILSSKQGKLTTLINNASVFLSETIQTTSPDEWDLVMNTNLKAIWYLSKHFAERFPSARRIISIGDAGASGAMEKHAVYALSKHALALLTEQMAVAYAPKVRVNLLSPGLVLKGDSEPVSIWEQRSKRVLTDNSDILFQVLDGIKYLMKDPGLTGSEIKIDNGFHLFNRR